MQDTLARKERSEVLLGLKKCFVLQVPDNIKEQTLAKKESTEVELDGFKKALESFMELKADN